MSNIITFYSYKGGVGRSMALANIAFELAKRGKKVLMIDWDLEAPGLERYFSNFELSKKPLGLLDLLIHLREEKELNYQDYLWTIYSNFSQPLNLIASGRDKDPVKYSKELERFDWKKFFDLNHGGRSLERLRNQWINAYDFILIDSRTGLSDASGVCTILLPDILVPMFTANYQSLFGIRDIVNFIMASRQKLPVDRMSLTILPIPCRFGTRVEFKESQEWLDRISDILRDYFSDWLPKWIEPRYILEKIKIPQVDFFSFGEKLAVFEQGTNDPEGLGFIYSKITDLLSSNFMDIKSFVGEHVYNEGHKSFKNSSVNLIENKSESKYKFDLFITYPRTSYQWMREILFPTLSEYLNDELGYNPQIYFDPIEARIGENWFNNYKSTMEASKVFLFILSDEETAGVYYNDSLMFAKSLQEVIQTNIIFPVIHKYNKDSKPNIVDSEYFNNIKIFDLSNFSVDLKDSSTKNITKFGSIVESLAIMISQSIISIGGETPKEEKYDNIISRILALSFEYENVRKNMPSGNNRTYIMQGIFDKMKEFAELIDVDQYLPELMESTSPGKRLSAIAMLQVKPNFNHLGWLARHVGDIEKPFVGYQAAVALYVASRSFAVRDKAKLIDILDHALINIKNYKFQDPEQISMINSAKKELNLY